MSDEPKSEKHAVLLRHSSFSTLSDARRFIEWYDESRYHSVWDDCRYGEAKMLIDFETEPKAGASQVVRDDEQIPTSMTRHYRRAARQIGDWLDVVKARLKARDAELQEASDLNNEMKALFDAACDERDALQKRIEQWEASNSHPTHGPLCSCAACERGWRSE